jgi:uncharacterized protein YdeI (YjbR/CyaY-like superfamily)
VTKARAKAKSKRSAKRAEPAKRNASRTAKANQSAKIGAKAKLGAQRFKATLERMRGNLGWVIVWIPFSVYEAWGSRGNFRVKGEINGFAFRTSLFPTRKGVHFLLVNKRMQAGAGVSSGDTTEFMLEPDTAERVAITPPELKRFLSEDKQFQKWYDALSYSFRKWFGDEINNRKSPESRERRAEQIAEQLFSAMEAERELPPAIRMAFANEPRALEGWRQMSPTHRRAQLIAIFYYRSPEAQARRLEKVVEAAVVHAAKKSARRSSEP